MADIKNKLVDVNGLRHIYDLLASWIRGNHDELNDRLNNKLGKATNVPVAGQILIADSNFRWTWRDPQGGSSSSVDEATIRRIVNEQLAKTKYTINDQGHLIIEIPEA